MNPIRTPAETLDAALDEVHACDYPKVAPTHDEALIPQGWQPIKTAPNCAPALFILRWGPRRPPESQIAVVAADGSFWRHEIARGDKIPGGWMPLPPTPAEAEPQP